MKLKAPNKRLINIIILCDDGFKFQNIYLLTLFIVRLDRIFITERCYSTLFSIIMIQTLFFKREYHTEHVHENLK